jgi:transposase InsO family protein
LKHTRPYRPQTYGKVERFHRTLATGWAFARFYLDETTRRAALPAWLQVLLTVRSDSSGRTRA